MNIPEGIVEFHDYMVQLSIIRGKLSEALKQKQFVRCIEKVTISPKTEQIVWTQAGREYHATGTASIEHYTSLDDCGLQVAKCLVNDCKETILCKVFKYTDIIVDLQPGTKIRVIGNLYSRCEQVKFLAMLWEITMSGIDSGERLLICGELNEHKGSEIDGFNGVHGGFSFGKWNVEDDMILETADALNLPVSNTFQEGEEFVHI